MEEKYFKRSERLELLHKKCIMQLHFNVKLGVGGK